MIRTFTAALLVVPSLLAAQRDSARLVGTVNSAFNGKPLAGVMIAVPATRSFVVTDSTGTFELTGLPSGRQAVRIAYEGRNTEEYRIELKAGKAKRLNVLLDVEAVDLAPIVVEGRPYESRRDLAGFYERKRWYAGFGRFYTRQDIERMRPTTVEQLLARAGVFVRCVEIGCVPTTFSRGRVCVLPVSVDGFPYAETWYNDLPIEEVAGVEVYRGGIGMPLDVGVTRLGPAAGWGGLSAGSSYFGRGSLFEGPGTCGAIQIWTRQVEG